MRHVDDLTGVAGRGDFPSFSEGLSLRRGAALGHLLTSKFPFLFGGTFIEALHLLLPPLPGPMIPFLFGGTFIEAERSSRRTHRRTDFPSFSEGLSLRVPLDMVLEAADISISLPVRKGFH